MDTGDPDFDAVLRMQRRRHRWGVSVFWLVGVAVVGWGSTSDADSSGTPPPAWFTDLVIGFAVAAGVALVIAIGYSVAMRRYPAPARAEAARLERQRLRRAWRYGWTGRIYRVLFWSAATLGMAMFLGLAVLGVPWVVHGAAYLAGDRTGLTWSGDIPVNDDGDAAGSVVIGLAFVFAGLLVLWYIYTRVRRLWWPRFVARRAAADAIQWPPVSPGPPAG